MDNKYKRFKNRKQEMDFTVFQLGRLLHYISINKIEGIITKDVFYDILYKDALHYFKSRFRDEFNKLDKEKKASYEYSIHKVCKSWSKRYASKNFEIKGAIMETKEPPFDKKAGQN